MDKQDLRKLSVKCIKYATFRVDASTALKGAENFEDLLRFIGVHKNYGRSYYAGNAYEAIRIRTDEILRLSNPKKVNCALENAKYRVSGNVSNAYWHRAMFIN